MIESSQQPQNESFDTDEEQPIQLINFKFVIAMHINDCRKALSRSQTEEEMEITKDALNVFEAMLTPYSDKKFEADIQRIEKDIAAKIKKENIPDVKQNNTKLKIRYDKERALLHFKALICLASRRGLASLKDIKEHI